MIALLLSVACLGPIQDSWTVDRPLADALPCLRDHFSSPAGHVAASHINAQGAEALGRWVPRLQAVAFPGSHYAWFRADLTPMARLTGFSTVEVWGQGPRTMVRLRTVFTLPRKGLIPRLIEGVAERAAFTIERAALEDLFPEAKP